MESHKNFFRDSLFLIWATLTSVLVYAQCKADLFATLERMKDKLGL